MENGFGQIIIAAMQERGWSMAELSRRSGVSYDVINKLKQRPHSSTTAANARALAVALNTEDYAFTLPGENPVLDEIRQLIDRLEPHEQAVILGALKGILSQRPAASAESQEDHL